MCPAARSSNLPRPNWQMSSCPHCDSISSDASGDAGTCGGFPCLYRQFTGGTAPQEARHLRPLPWDGPQEVQRVLVLRPGQLGDLLLAVPGLRALRAGFPKAEISLVVQPWATGLFGRFRYVDRVLPLPIPLADWGGADVESHSFVAEARCHRYDLVLQLQADGGAAARLALALGGRVTAGFCPDEAIARDFHIPLSMVRDEPEVLRVLRLLDAIGVRPAGVQAEFPLLPEDRDELDAIPGLRRALQRRPVVAIHPGARAPARRWPLRRFVELAHRLHDRWGDTLIVVGGPEELDLAAELQRHSGIPVLNLAGRLSLGGLAALLGEVDLFVGNDSGPSQLAAVVAPRSVRIFGPANRGRWAPLDQSRHRVVYRQVDCSPCGHWECPIDHRCLEWVTVEQVAEQIDSLLSIPKQPASTWSDIHGYSHGAGRPC